MDEGGKCFDRWRRWRSFAGGGCLWTMAVILDAGAPCSSGRTPIEVFAAWPSYSSAEKRRAGCGRPPGSRCLSLATLLIVSSCSLLWCSFGFGIRMVLVWCSCSYSG